MSVVRSQAKVSVSDVYAYVNSFASQPLLFVDHPVMITHNATDAAADAEWTRKDLNMTKGVMPQVLSLRERRHGRMVIPDEALSAVNHHIRHGRCKANWVGHLRLSRHSQKHVLHKRT